MQIHTKLHYKNNKKYNDTMYTGMARQADVITAAVNVIRRSHATRSKSIHSDVQYTYGGITPSSHIHS